MPAGSIRMKSGRAQSRRNANAQTRHQSGRPAIAMKFAAAISPNRGDESRPQDRVDLVAIIKKHASVDTQVLTQLGDLVYPGGGKEPCDLVTAVGQGRKAAL